MKTYKIKVRGRDVAPVQADGWQAAGNAAMRTHGAQAAEVEVEVDTRVGFVKVSVVQ